MVSPTQGFEVLLNVYVRQYRAEVSAEIKSARSNYRTPDNLAMLDQDIDALARVCTQVDGLLTGGALCTQRIFTQARMLVILAEANAGAIKSHLPLIEGADLRYISGPMVAVLDQARLKASAKRIVDIDGVFLNNVMASVDKLKTVVAVAFPMPLPEPEPRPIPLSTHHVPPRPTPQSGSRPDLQSGSQPQFQPSPWRGLNLDDDTPQTMPTDMFGQGGGAPVRGHDEDFMPNVPVWQVSATHETEQDLRAGVFRCTDTENLPPGLADELSSI